MESTLLVLDSLDEQFMQEALAEAEKAFERDEVPVGAVAVRCGVVIARAFNQVESLQDASAHAELLCLKEASKVLGRWRLSDVTLYSSLEPCSMCAGALFSFRIARLVWGAPDVRQGADGSFIPLLSSPHPIHSFPVRGGVLSELSACKLKLFFQKRRGRGCLLSNS